MSTGKKTGVQWRHKQLLIQRTVGTENYKLIIEGFTLRSVNNSVLPVVYLSESQNEFCLILMGFTLIGEFENLGAPFPIYMNNFIYF